MDFIFRYVLLHRQGILTLQCYLDLRQTALFSSAMKHPVVDVLRRALHELLDRELAQVLPELDPVTIPSIKNHWQ